MLKIFWDIDNIAFIGDRVDSIEHSHCLLQVFLSLDEPLQVEVDNERVCGKCIIVNKNTKHKFSCRNRVCLSILIEPSSSFAKELIKRIEGNYLILDNGIDSIQQKASILLDTNDKEVYIDFIKDELVKKKHIMRCAFKLKYQWLFVVVLIMSNNIPLLC